jgi:hypothetical protein
LQLLLVQLYVTDAATILPLDHSAAAATGTDHFELLRLCQDVLFAAGCSCRRQPSAAMAAKPSKWLKKWLLTNNCDVYGNHMSL